MVEYVEKLNAEIVLFNENSEAPKLSARISFGETATLYLDDKLLTNGDVIEVYDRVRQINREHGNQLLG